MWNVFILKYIFKSESQAAPFHRYVTYTLQACYKSGHLHYKQSQANMKRDAAVRQCLITLASYKLCLEIYLLIYNIELICLLLLQLLLLILFLFFFLLLLLLLLFVVVVVGLVVVVVVFRFLFLISLLYIILVTLLLNDI